MIEFLNRKFTQYEIGDYTYGNDPVIFDWNEGSTLKIGKFCSIGSGVMILLGGNHYTDRISTYPFHKMMLNIDKYDHHTKGDVNIGSDVWLANFSAVLSGINIGHGSIIGAFSVVTKDIEPYSIAVGYPAKVIKKRFCDSDIEKLLKIQWWNWDIKKIQKHWKLIVGKDVNKLCELI